MAARRSDPPPPQDGASSWLVGALDQRTDIVPPAWPDRSASHRNVVQLPVVSDELERALRARGPKRLGSSEFEPSRRSRHPTPRAWRNDASSASESSAQAPIVHVVGSGLAPAPAGPTRPSAYDTNRDGAGAVGRAGVSPSVGEWAPHDGPAVPQVALGSQSAQLAPYAADPRHAPPGVPMVPPARGLEHPLVLGALLLVAPPVGLALLWSSRAYGREAKIALTGFSAMMVVLAAAFGLVLLAR